MDGCKLVERDLVVNVWINPKRRRRRRGRGCECVNKSKEEEEEERNGLWMC